MTVRRKAATKATVTMGRSLEDSLVTAAAWQDAACRDLLGGADQLGLGPARTRGPRSVTPGGATRRRHLFGRRVGGLAGVVVAVLLAGHLAISNMTSSIIDRQARWGSLRPA